MRRKPKNQIDASAPAGQERAPLREGQNPFLKAADVSNGAVFTMTGWVRRARGAFGEQIIVEVTQDATGTPFDFGVGVGSLNHKKLFKACGPDESRWQGEIVVDVQQGRNNSFVNIVEVHADNVPF